MTKKERSERRVAIGTAVYAVILVLGLGVILWVS